MSKEVFIVFIINCIYTRWEIFLQETYMSEVFNLLKTKYNIKKCTIQIKDIVLCDKSVCMLKDICPYGTSMYINTTKPFKLDKNII